LTEDIYHAFINQKASPKNLLLISRLSVLLVAIIAYILSIHPKDSILALVGNAWAGFGAAFGPVILLALLWRQSTKWGALSGMLVGGITVLAWVYLPHNYKDIYEIIPGFILGLSVNIIVSILTKKEDPSIQAEFDEVEKLVKQQK